jgi:LmbE family N-acetylglucosaminyl deacetylase
MGKQVVLIACTSGGKGSSDPEMTAERLAEIREQEQKAAARVLGIKETVFLRYADQELEDTPELRKQIVRLIRQYRPDILVTCDPYRRYITHRDHRITGQVCLDAVFPYARDHLAYPDLIDEGFAPHKVREVLCWYPEKGNHLVDITATFDQKLKALNCHESQLSGFGIPEIGGWLKEMGKKMAEEEPFDMAEAFHRVELPR